MLPIIVLWLALAMAPVELQRAHDTPWPGLWGSSRNGTVLTGRPTRPTGLREVWRRRTGGGYSEVIIGPGVLYSMEKHGANDTVVGGSTANERNVISGNGGQGVSIFGTSSMSAEVTGAKVSDNYIGTDLTGTVARGNTHGGVLLQGNAHDNVIIADSCPAIQHVDLDLTLNGLVAIHALNRR